MLVYTGKKFVSKMKSHICATWLPKFCFCFFCTECLNKKNTTSLNKCVLSIICLLLHLANSSTWFGQQVTKRVTLSILYFVASLLSTPAKSAFHIPNIWILYRSIVGLILLREKRSDCLLIVFLTLILYNQTMHMVCEGHVTPQGTHIISKYNTSLY